MKNKLKTVFNVLYIVDAACVFILVAYTVYGSYSFWHGPGLASYLSPLMPFILNTYTVIALGAGTLPMAIACAAFYKLNKIGQSWHGFWKFNLIFLPAYICAFSLMILLFDMMTAQALQHF